MTKPSTITFNELSGVRAIAAYMVYFHHFLPPFAFLPFLLPIIKEFHTGVTVFFVLSGFLICLKYYEKVSFDKYFLFDYFKNRFARIYPIYFLAILLTFLFATLPAPDFPFLIKVRNFFLEATFLRGFFDEFKFLGVGQGWTLTVEETFYFLFPFMVFFIKKSRLSFVLLGIYLIGFFLFTIGAAIEFHSFFYPERFIILYTFFGRAAEFIIGMFLALILLKRDTILPKNGIPWTTLIGIIGCLGGLFIMSRYQSPEVAYGVFTWQGMFLNNIILPIFIATLFFGLITEETIFRKVLGSRLFVLLGKASYAFYLFHIGPLRSLFIDKITNHWALAFLLTILCSIAIYYFIEEPSRHKIRNIHFDALLQIFRRNFIRGSKPKEVTE